MVYPSLWVPGEYRVADPARNPYDIVERSLEDFQVKSAATAVGMTPWLQDFSLNGVTYGDKEVRAQIDAAASLGIHGFLLWNPWVRYDAGALDPGAGS
jgi:Putative glycosyl hydrolase domain